VAAGFDVQVNPAALRQFAAGLKSSLLPVSRACGQVGGNVSAVVDRERSVPGGIGDALARFGAVWDVELEYIGQDGVGLATVFDGVADVYERLDNELAAKVSG
jgi:hypothetical protein